MTDNNVNQNTESQQNNTQASIESLMKIAKAGNANAQFDLGLCYEKGDGIEKDLKKAAFWYQRAAVRGHAKAQLLLGACYKDGNGVERDFENAIFWYKKALKQGCEEAQRPLDDLLGYAYSVKI